ncbi:MAG TPA: FAD-dependent oxidoreductase, partial [Herpetosiphonaceae bacterium]
MDALDRQFDAGIIGGGLAGLAAATVLARAGRSVAVLEQASHVGGRAYSRAAGGYTFNLGPHALYRGGEAETLLRELGVEFGGKIVANQIARALRGGKAHLLPEGAGSLLRTTLLDWRGKLAFAKLLTGIGRLDSGPLQGVAVSAWLDSNVKHPVVREAVLALIRVATYGDAPDAQSMGSALDQLKLALSSGVWYLDGGWQTLVDGLRAAA